MRKSVTESKCIDKAHQHRSQLYDSEMSSVRQRVQTRICIEGSSITHLSIRYCLGSWLILFSNIFYFSSFRSTLPRTQGKICTLAPTARKRSNANRTCTNIINNYIPSNGTPIEKPEQNKLPTYSRYGGLQQSSWNYWLNNPINWNRSPEQYIWYSFVCVCVFWVLFLYIERKLRFNTATLLNTFDRN